MGRQGTWWRWHDDETLCKLGDVDWHPGKAKRRRWRVWKADVIDGGYGGGPVNRHGRYKS